MEFLTVWSLRFDAGELDHLAPLLDFIADEFGKLAGRVRRRRYDAEFDEPLPDPRVAKGGIDQLVERRDDVRRRGRGGAEADPAERLVALEHAVDGRHVRQGRKPLFRRHAERPRRSRLDLRQRRGGDVEHHLHLARDEIGDGRRRAPVGDVGEVHAGHVGCPIGALANPQVTYLADAKKAGAEVRALSTVTRVLTNPAGTKVTGVEYYDAKREKQVQEASVVVLAAWSAQNPRLMMISATDKHPKGLANSGGVLGKYMMAHYASGTWELFDEDVENHMQRRAVRLSSIGGRQAPYRTAPPPASA